MCELLPACRPLAPGTGRSFPHPVVSLGNGGGVSWHEGWDPPLHPDSSQPAAQGEGLEGWPQRSLQEAFWQPDAAKPESLSPEEEGERGRPSACVVSAQKADGSKSPALDGYSLRPQGWGSHPTLSRLQPPEQGQGRVPVLQVRLNLSRSGEARPQTQTHWLQHMNPLCSAQPMWTHLATALGRAVARLSTCHHRMEGDAGSGASHGHIFMETTQRTL